MHFIAADFFLFSCLLNHEYQKYYILFYIKQCKYIHIEYSLSVNLSSNYIIMVQLYLNKKLISLHLYCKTHFLSTLTSV